MTLDDVDNWIIGGVGTVFTALVGALRYGDLNRIEAIEKKQKEQDDHVATEVRALRTELHDNSRDIKNDLEAKHAQLVGLLVGLQK